MVIFTIGKTVYQMNPGEPEQPTKIMPYALRLLEEADIGQSAEIERDAFPTLFPPTSFRRELKNSLAKYLVAWRRDDLIGRPPDDSVPDSPNQRTIDNSGRPLIGRLMRNARSFWRKRDTAWEPGQQFLAGFLGTWYMVDEAHVVAVGVRSLYRGNGIGELLLIGAIEQAFARNSRVVTLEVRASNHVAQNLYTKYRFSERGVRKGYYTDNREDALIMTTDPIHDSSFEENFRDLVEVHEGRWGYSDRMVL